MENRRKTNSMYALLSISILIINVIVIVIFRDSIAITKYSIPSLVFAFCSLVYAIIAIAFRDRVNLFFLNLHIIAKIFNKSYNETQEYKEDFLRFALVYCASIPIYITASLFADNFYSGIIWALDISIVREAIIIFMGLVPPFVKNIKAKKQQRTKDEADRKEQERRESMGNWK